jgi:hypothetical protein
LDPWRVHVRAILAPVIFGLGLLAGDAWHAAELGRRRGTIEGLHRPLSTV